MAAVVYKYRIETLSPFTVSMSANARVLSAQMNHGTAYMWALTREEDKLIDRVFYLVGTGNQLPDSAIHNWKYISTFQMKDGNILAHLFEEVS